MKRYLVLGLILFLFYGIFAQNNPDEKLISVDVRQKPLKEVFAGISSQSGYYFSYNPQLIDDKRIVTFIVRKKPLVQVLDVMANEFSLEYIFSGNNIILKPRPEAANPGKQKPRVFSVKGFVQDAATGEVIISAAIFLDKKLVALTNEYGFFSFKCPAGKHLLEVSYVGYDRYRKIVDITSDVQINLHLKVNPQLLDYVVVTPEDNTRPISANSLDFINFPQALVKRNPALGGTYDALKSLQAIPGFNFYGDGSMIFHVRGGDQSQNLILIDDAPVFNPVHMLGFFSAVSPWAVSDIKVYKNDLPVQYPGRVSSVIDIRLREGDFFKYHLNGEVSPILSAMTFEGPVLRGKSSFMISARTSNINWLYDNSNSFMRMNFWDLQTKFNFNPDKKNKFFVSLFYSKDFIRLTRDFIASSMWWSNIAGTVRWNHVFNNRLFLNTTFFTGQYSYFLRFIPDTVNVFNSAISVSGLKEDFSYKLSNTNTLRFGLGLFYYYFNPANINNLAYIPTQNALDIYAYIGDRWIIADKIKLNLGINLHRWANMGPTIVYYYDDLHSLIATDTIGLQVFNSYLRSEPRASISYAISPRWIVKLSYGNYSQFLNLLSTSISPFTTVEAWFPANNNIPPVNSRQLSLGVYKKGNNVDFSLELYARGIKNTVHFSGFSSLLFNPYIEADIRIGTNLAAGMELYLSKSRGRLNYWFSYTYGRVFMQVPELYGDYWIYTSYDKPHNLLFSLSYSFERVRTGLLWVYNSGNRFSAPVGYYRAADRYIPIYSYPNNATLPPYHRLDFYLTMRLNKNPNNKFSHYLTFSLFNAYGRKNPVMVNFNKVQDGENFFYVPGNYIYEYQLTPAYYYFMRFVPSLSYRFKF